MNEHIYSCVSEYYSAKIIKNGATPEGVDWNGEKSQRLRFDVATFFDTSHPETVINDLGCGYGAYFEFLTERFDQFTYRGYDLSREMIDEANKLYGTHKLAPQFLNIKNGVDMKVADYSVASGIFNVKMTFSEQKWLDYILETIATLNASSRKGFSFNVLTKYSDQNKKKDHLYYADPLYLFDYCKMHISRNVALLHDYNLYEFTIIVRK